MNRATIFLLLLSTALLAPNAFAHDEKYHKKHYVEGEVTERSGDSFLLQTGSGQVRVETNKDTVFEKGANGDRAELKDLKKPDHVRVAGTKLESDKMIAKEVLIGDASESGHEAATHSH